MVHKKGVDEQENRIKRLVIDFRELNFKTVDPIPNIAAILGNLGKTKYFTQGQEKTAFPVANGKYCTNFADSVLVWKLLKKAWKGLSLYKYDSNRIIGCIICQSTVR